ncbi:MAG: hypothetical protein JO372_02345 [Solirubrobacterales bacterium]|nr:hypothetical protein [Solirubrobacterales bacterium]
MAPLTLTARGALLSMTAVDGRTGDGRGETLRIGVLLDGIVVDHWVASILREVAAAPFCELALFVFDAEPVRRSFPAKIWNSRHRLVFLFYTLVDGRLSGKPDDAFARIDLSSEFATVPRLEVMRSRRRRFEHRFDAGTIDAIRESQLDVLLRFGFDIIPGDILTAARFGVWSFHHDDNMLYRGGPPLFWEMAERNPVSGTMLQMLTEGLDGGKVIYRSWSATDPLSLRRGSNAAYWKTSHFVIRRLRDIHERGWTYVTSLPDPADRVSYEQRVCRAPSNRQALGFLARIGTGYLKRNLIRFFFREQWVLLYRRASHPSVGTFCHTGSHPVTRGLSRFGRRRDAAGLPFQLVTPPVDRFYADPFLLSSATDTFLVFEDFRWAAGKAVISCARPDNMAHVKVALDRPYHLSYPFTFSYDGRCYMIPESMDRRTIELYSAERVPDRWRFERVLMEDIAAVDATLFHDGKRFWLFACVPEPGASFDDELCLFYTTDLDGEWMPHPLNPIVSDVRRARPAGAVFKLGDDLIRPGQDCSRRYGSAIVFHRIDELTVEGYSETVIDRLDGQSFRGMFAAHTYNFSDGLEVIDARRYCRRKWNL